MSQIPPEGRSPFGDTPYVSPKAPVKMPVTDEGGDATGGVIPYKNPAALIGYYLGVFSLIPCLGFFLAVPALVLGIVGLRAYSNNPLVKGRVHAWVAIIAGSIFTILWGGLLLFSLGAAIMGNR